MTEELKVEAETPVGSQTGREGAIDRIRGQPGTWFAPGMVPMEPEHRMSSMRIA